VKFVNVVTVQVSAHLAMACGAGQVPAKPGMGVDEGLMIVGNAMARVARTPMTPPERVGQSWSSAGT
jgi:methylaspartate ammonia-lyase